MRFQQAGFWRWRSFLLSLVWCFAPAAVADGLVVEVLPAEPTTADAVTVRLSFEASILLEMGPYWLDATNNEIRAYFFDTCVILCPTELKTFEIPIGQLAAGIYHIYGTDFTVSPAPTTSDFGLEFAPAVPTDGQRVLVGLPFDLAPCQILPEVVDVRRQGGTFTISLLASPPPDACAETERRLASRQLELGPLEAGTYTVQLESRETPGGTVTPQASRNLVVTAAEGAVLLLDRYRVTLDWRTEDGQTGRAKALPGASAGLGPKTGSAASALFTFFGPDNWEVLIKVLDGCALNSHRWVFLAAATTVEFTLTIVDQEGIDPPYVYQSPGGHPAPPLTDTAALSCLP